MTGALRPASSSTPATALPRAARATAPAAHPPAGLPGLRDADSRLVLAPESGAEPGSARGWHLLDNGAELAAAGIRPVGTLLCVHGNPTWSYLWRGLLAAATASARAGGTAWRVVAVDQLEMGFSERTGLARPLARRVRDLGDLTAALGLAGPVVTVGHDWGGPVSLGWAVDHPDLLAGVVLLNTAVAQPEGAAIPAPLRVALQASVLGRATVTTPGFLEATLALGHPPLSAAVKAGYRAPYRSAERRGGIGGFVADIPFDAATPSAPELHRIGEGIRSLDVPSLLLRGPQDPVFLERYLVDLLERLPNSDVHRFEGAGHLLAEDVDYASAVLTWLDDRLPAGSPAAAPAATEPPPASDRRLWAFLDERAASAEAALVEMAPPGGGGPRTVSWRLLARRVREIAAGLSATGVRPGDRVSLLVTPGADLTAVLYACLRIGAVVVVADAGLGLAGLTRAVRGAAPAFVIGAPPGLTAARALGWPGRRISSRDLGPVLGAALGVEASLPELARLGAGLALPPEPDPADLAAILFTSGSTGPAKGVRYTAAQLEALRDVLASTYDVGPETGLVAGFAPFALLGPALGARSVTPEMDVTSPRTLTARAVAASVLAADATVLFLSPAALANVVATADRLEPAEHHALRRLRLLLSAGAPLSEPLLEAAAALLPDAAIHTPYGMTEGLLVTDISLAGLRDVALDGDQIGAGGVCVGLPGAGTRVRISALDEAGRAVGEPDTQPGVTGEIVVSARHLEDGYDRLWLTDRASRLGTTPGERWHRTGDVGHLDGAGRVWVEGRLVHVIVTETGVVTPVGTEQRIETVPLVARCALVAVGPAGVSRLVAVVETTGPRRAGLADGELAAQVRAAARRPLAAVLTVRALPTDIRHNSKIDRARVARWAERVLSGGRIGRP